jgi:hypothetical protein
MLPSPYVLSQLSNLPATERCTFDFVCVHLQMILEQAMADPMRQHRQADILFSAARWVLHAIASTQQPKQRGTMRMRGILIHISM